MYLPLVLVVPPLLRYSSIHHNLECPPFPPKTAGELSSPDCF